MSALLYFILIPVIILWGLVFIPALKYRETSFLLAVVSILSGIAGSVITLLLTRG